MIIIPKSLIGELKIREVKQFLKITQQVSSRVGIQHEKHVIMRLWVSLSLLTFLFQPKLDWLSLINHPLVCPQIRE